jgi:hypothetical protein
MPKTTYVIAALWLLSLPARADITLFDGTLSTTPNAQGWLYLTNPIAGSSATQTPSSTGTTLDTTAATSDQAGYFAKLGSYSHPLLPVLDRTSGYMISFDMAVQAESHSSNDRSGFSLIVLSQDLKGIELEFWTNRVWAQADAPLFTQAEGVATDTTLATAYELAIAGDSYTLSSAGSTLLAGPLRDYSSFGAPYTTPSFLFMGDNSTTSNARVKLASVGVSLASVPEPGTWRLFASGIGSVVAGLAIRYRRLNPFRTNNR